MVLHHTADCWVDIILPDDHHFVIAGRVHRLGGNTDGVPHGFGPPYWVGAYCLGTVTGGLEVVFAVACCTGLRSCCHLSGKFPIQISVAFDISVPMMFIRCDVGNCAVPQANSSSVIVLKKHCLMSSIVAHVICCTICGPKQSDFGIHLFQVQYSP